MVADSMPVPPPPLRGGQRLDEALHEEYRIKCDMSEPDEDTRLNVSASLEMLCEKGKLGFAGAALSETQRCTRGPTFPLLGGIIMRIVIIAVI